MDIDRDNESERVAQHSPDLFHCGSPPSGIYTRVNTEAYACFSLPFRPVCDARMLFYQEILFASSPSRCVRRLKDKRVRVGLEGRMRIEGKKYKRGDYVRA